LQLEGQKLGKSLGNAIDPRPYALEFGIDAMRYFLLREFPFGPDGNFTRANLINRYNADLANDLGNLLSRTVGMVEKYFGGALPAFEYVMDADLQQTAANAITQAESHMDRMAFSEALTEIWALVRRTNKYIDEQQPWVMTKDETKRGELANVLYHLAEVLRILAVAVAPVMPGTPAVIREQLNITDEALFTWESAKTFGLLPQGLRVTKGPAAFPRIECKENE
jgi:methionyl-tRNA synthetase